MNAPSLKQSLAHWTGFPTIERTFEPRDTREAAAIVEKLFGDIPPTAPTTYDLQALHRRVVTAWHRDNSLARLDLRDLKQLPHILFYPPRERKGTGQSDATRVNPQADLFSLPPGTRTEDADWLGAEPAVLREYRRWLSTGRRTGSVLALLHEFLRVYPVALPTFNELRHLLQDTLEGDSLALPTSLRRWQHRCQKFGFLEPRGADALVQRVISDADTPDEVLRQAGLDPRLAGCGFLESAISAYLPHAESLLSEGRLDDALVSQETRDGHQ